MILLLFIFGLCMGSFINVLVDRIPRGESILFGRSHCDYCGQSLAWYDLVPVFSYLFIQGKCRYCKKKLSMQYPLVEVATALLFVATFFIESTYLQYSIFLDLGLVSICFALFLMDIKYRILSDTLLLPVFLVTLLRILVTAPTSVFFSLAVGFFAMLPLLLIFLFSKGRAMGFGDVKLIFCIGFLVGFPNILIAYYVAFLTGAMTGIILVIGRKRKFKGATIAFGPFLLIGMTIAILWGSSLWNYAVRLLGI